MVCGNNAGVNCRAAGGSGSSVTSDILAPAVMEWAGRAVPGARVARCSVRPLTGGAVARQVDQVTLHLTGHREPPELVRKEAPAHEIAGLRAAQAVAGQPRRYPSSWRGAATG